MTGRWAQAAQGVERVDERRGGREELGRLGGEGWTEGVLRREAGVHAPALLAEERGERVGGGDVAWAGKLTGLVGHERGVECVSGEERAEVRGRCSGVCRFGGLGEERLAVGLELLAGGHKEAGGKDPLGRGEVEVEAGAAGARGGWETPPGGHARVVGALVVAEAGVAVDAEHGAVRGGADVVRGEGLHGRADGRDEGQHGGFEFVLVGGAAWLEPLAVVVAGEAAEEAQGGGGEVRWSGRRAARVRTHASMRCNLLLEL